MEKPLRLFVSYAREDAAHRRDLRGALSSLVQTGLIRFWSDREIGAGADWDEAIDGKLQDAQLIVFLISQDFVNSSYVMTKEYEVAMARRREGEAVVIPVSLRAVNIRSHPLGALNLVPRSPAASDQLMPLRGWSDPDAFWTAVSTVVEDEARKLLGEAASPTRVPAAASPPPSPTSARSERSAHWELRRIAGTGGKGLLGDGGPAREAQFRAPIGIAKIGADLFVADIQSDRLRRIDGEGTIHDFAPVLACEQVCGTAMWYDSVYAAGGELRAVYSIQIESGELTEVVPPGNRGPRISSGNGGPARDARFRTVTGIAATNGLPPDLFVSDRLSHHVRFVPGYAENPVSPFAGNGTRGYTGDHGPADRAQLNAPRDLAWVGGGMLGESYLYIADTDNHVIRRVRWSDREIVTVAGTGEAGFAGDGGPAIEARLDGPQGIAVDRAGRLIIADTRNHRIRLVDRDGVITTIAGTGQIGYWGDARDARASDLSFPRGITVPEYGPEIYVCDSGHRRIVTLTPTR